MHPRLLTTALVFAGCAHDSPLPISASTGSTPTLVEPHQALVPDVNIAKAKGWSRGQTPMAAQGTKVVAFARDLDHPRWLYVLPNGDVLVEAAGRAGRPRRGG